MQLLAAPEGRVEQLWRTRVHSAFVYASPDPAALQILAQKLTQNPRAAIQAFDPSSRELFISDKSRELCGIMSGLRISLPKNVGGTGFLFTTSLPQNAIELTSVGRLTTFLKIVYNGVSVHLSTSPEIVDISAEMKGRNFDVREHVLSAVPIVLYVNWAFAKTCWRAPEANACLVIDDLLLKPSYGFVDYQELLNLMECHRFSTNIAFIPWNWRRSDPKVVRLFKSHPDKYSLSIHGCDHIAAEFGIHDRQRLSWKARQAVERMSGHESKTGLRHDRIMVFPQGVFSAAAMGVLKDTNFTAAVNTEVISTDPKPPAIRICDVWDVAVMSYASFPIFTRRYPSQGIENFAFDLLLGKPCIVVTHHDFFGDGYKQLVDFITGLNALAVPLSWRSLGDVVSRSCRQRELASQKMAIEMYGTVLRVENHSDQQKQFLIRKREPTPSAIKEILADSRLIAWNSSGDYIDFKIELNGGQNTTIAINYLDLTGNGQSRDDVSYRAKTMVRRYLCEARDNYVMRSKVLSRVAGFLK
jgi:hypothetical protein